MLLTMVMGVMIALAQSGEPVRLIWDPGNVGNERYLVYRAAVSGGPYQRLTAEPIRPPFYIDDGVSAGATYYYVVSTVDKSGNQSPYSSEVKLTVDHPRAPGFISKVLPDERIRDSRCGDSRFEKRQFEIRDSKFPNLESAIGNWQSLISNPELLLCLT